MPFWNSNPYAAKEKKYRNLYNSLNNHLTRVNTHLNTLNTYKTPTKSYPTDIPWTEYENAKRRIDRERDNAINALQNEIDRLKSAKSSAYSRWKYYERLKED